MGKNLIDLVKLDSHETNINTNFFIYLQMCMETQFIDLINGVHPGLVINANDNSRILCGPSS